MFPPKLIKEKQNIKLFHINVPTKMNFKKNVRSSHEYMVYDIVLSPTFGAINI